MSEEEEEEGRGGGGEERRGGGEKKKKIVQALVTELGNQKIAITIARKPHTSLKHSDTKIKIAYRTNNTSQENFTPKTHNHEKFSATGVFKLTRVDCSKAYMGQTGRNFSIRHNEYLRAFRKYSNSSKFAQHLNEHMHTFGSIENMQIINYQEKGPHVNNVESFYSHKEAAFENQLNDKHTTQNS